MNIVITGAGRGIGLELVKSFGNTPGHRVVAISRNGQGIEKLISELNLIPGSSPVTFLTADLTDFGPIDKLSQKILQSIDGVDILINNAGTMVNKPFGKLTGSDFDQLFAIHVKAVFFLVKGLLPHFREGAHIVNIGSMGGFQGSVKFPGLSLYSASKGALAVLTECMAEEFRDLGIRANCLALGAVRTEMVAEAFPGYQPPTEPSEMAAFISDFALNGHRYFNGKILPVAVSTP